MILQGRIKDRVEINQGALDQFQASLSGELLLPADPGYEQARTVWNAMIDRKPGLIARCRGVADIISAVAFAREYDVLVSIKGGGHNIAGLAVCDECLMLDMSLMRGVWVDVPSRTARVQPGCILADVDRETQVHGLAAVLGFVSQTGATGLTLGGGFGYLTRRFGWTCDNLVAMELVTADGRLVRASQDNEPDLFWGLRGGGGNFGVVTGLAYQLYPVGPQVVGGIIAWSADQASEVLDMYRELSETAPPEACCVVMQRYAPPAPWLPAYIHGKPIIGMVVCYSGPVEEGEKWIATIKALGRPAGDVIQRRPYVTQQNILDATQPKGRRYYWKSEYLPKVEPEMLAKVQEHAQTMPSPLSAIVVFPLGGALNQLPDEHSPMGNRDAEYVVNITASWEDAADDEANIAWARRAWQDMRPFSTGGTYINFLTADEGDDRTQAAYRSNYQRLVEVKSKWDPQNMFRMNKNIAPQAA